ncbi:TetR family transcriptional regulator [Streptomyces pinistramenti]|uniref:TetR family transcriptional regulator n=1 Tax=Streptomyces pinistramenti TaxID=2884812 RepID=UPI001D06A390|nr:TetR family transcriptional regulator [Streptomyces pinistramenti]MCB5908444.1 TetR family transcriptional regulator [Streptomyces pinistramenti]
MSAERTGTEARPDRRARRSRRTREALARAALELVLDRGLREVSVEDIAERADVARRTFSRYFTGKEEAVADCIRADADRINDALRARPAAEPPLVAYRAAVLDWLTDEDEPAWHRRPHVFDLLTLAERESMLYAALQHTRVAAQEDSVRILAGRLGADPEVDLRPAVLVGAGAGALVAAQHAWVRGGELAALPGLVERAFAALTDAAPSAAPAAHPGEPPDQAPVSPQGI